jgi:hypothetical protein
VYFSSQIFLMLRKLVMAVVSGIWSNVKTVNGTLLNKTNNTRTVYFVSVLWLLRIYCLNIRQIDWLLFYAKWALFCQPPLSWITQDILLEFAMDWLLFNLKWAFFFSAIYMTRTSLSYIFIRWWWWNPLSSRPTCLLDDFYGASSLKQKSIVDMSLHSDTFFWFRANQSLLFLLSALCLAEKQQISILKSLVWSPDLVSNPDLPY